MTVLYFHGFASSPASSKITLLRPLLAGDSIELDTPDLNAPSFEELDWNAVVERAVAAARARPPALIAGSSLGGLVALEVARALADPPPLLLVAPALGIADQWLARIPAGDPLSIYNHARDANAPIHRRFFEQMSRVDIDRHPPPTRVSVIMGANDESVPFERVEGVWQAWERSGGLAKGSKFVTIKEGDHGLTAHVELIANELRAAINPSG